MEKMREWNVLLEVEEEEENRMKNGLGGDKHLSDFLTTPAPPIFMAKVILPCHALSSIRATGENIKRDLFL